MRKKEIVLCINPCIYGLNYHDPGAALFIDGELAFGIEEEKLIGIKNVNGIFPHNSIKACLNFGNLQWKDINSIAIGYDPKLWKKRLEIELAEIIKRNDLDNEDHSKYKTDHFILDIEDSDLIKRFHFFSQEEKIKNLILNSCKVNENIEIKFFEHHLSHIASSYELSGFNESVGIVVDGIGESACTTIWEIKNSTYKKILQIDFPNSLGYFYAAATKFLGFKPWAQEGKTMALAAYGHDDVNIRKSLKQIFKTDFIYDVSNFIESNSKNLLMIDEEKAVHSLEDIMGFKACIPGNPPTEDHINFAWAVQNSLEQSVINLVNYAINLTGITNVCVAGGVFMNCKLNMIIREKSQAKKLFVQPLAGDIGLILGSGLHAPQAMGKK